MAICFLFFSKQTQNLFSCREVNSKWPTFVSSLFSLSNGRQSWLLLSFWKNGQKPKALSVPSLYKKKKPSRPSTLCFSKNHLKTQLFSFSFLVASFSCLFFSFSVLPLYEVEACPPFLLLWTSHGQMKVSCKVDPTGC